MREGRPDPTILLLSFAYNVTTPGGTYRIEESLALTNEGIHRPRIVVPGACM